MRENTENTLHILIHELKNPLTVIKGYSELIKISDKKSSNEYADIISTETDYVTYLVNNISTLNKITENIPMVLSEDTIEVKSVADRLILIYRDRYSKIQWDNNIDESFTVKCDDMLFRIMLFNLIENAAKYTVKGNVSLTSYTTDTHSVIEIKDSGCGIEKDKIPKLTQLYYRANSQHPGSGVGLYLVSKICEKCDAVFEITSEPGKGCCAKVSFPIK